MKILLLSLSGSLYSTRRLFNEASRRGHYVKIVDHSECYTIMKSGKTKLFYEGKDISKTFDAVIPRIGASHTIHGATIVKQLELNNIYTIASSQGILDSRNKLRTIQILAANNIPIPKTLYSLSTIPLEEQLKHLKTEQYIIKLQEGTHGIGVMLAESKKSAISIIETMESIRKPILIQEFIKESNGEDIRAYVVGNKVVASMKRSSAGDDFRSNVHRGGNTYNIKLTKEEEKIAIKTAKCLNLDVAGIDIIRSSKGPLVIEANSTAGLEGIEGVTDVNIAGEIIKFIEKNEK